MATDEKLAAAASAGRRPSEVKVSSPRLPALLLFLGTLVVYWLTRTSANTFDAVSYANQIAHLYPRTGDAHWLFHPHHLLFNTLGYVLWQAAKLCGYSGGSLVILQSLNATLGAAGVSLYYLTLRRLLQRSRGLPLLISLGLALSFGYWICATDGRVNMPSIFLMLAAFSVLSCLMVTPRVGLAALTGLLAGAAVLFHESTGLFLVVGLAGVLLADDDPLLIPEAMRRRRLQMLAAYGSAWAATAALPYLLVGVLVLHLHSPSAFRSWTSEYSELGWWWDFHILHNLTSDFYAFRHASFVEPGSKPGTFTLSRHIPWLLVGLYSISVLGWLAAAYAIVAALPQLWRSHNRNLIIVLSLWSVVYAAFFTVWSPGYFVFWVPVLVPSSLMLALALAHYRARRGGRAANWVVGIWIAVYGALNLQVSILPHLAPQSDPFRRIATDVRAHTQFGDVVLVAGAGDGGPCEVALPYFADRDVISLHGLLTKKRDDKAAALQMAQSDINAVLSSGHAVYALDDVIPSHDAHTLAALSTKHHLTDADLKTLLSPYVRTLAWESPRGPVWQLTEKRCSGPCVETHG
ncbi:MAG: hypothetical protein ACRYFS_08255 [Janthinobacterium lividum]